MRVAAIDIGTNTVLLLVAETASANGLVAVTDRATITRLGEGVDRSRTLLPAAVARTRACLDEYAKVVRDLGATAVAIVGTSAMRDAHGSDELRAHIQAAFGVGVRVLTGAEEASLTFRGALSGLPQSNAQIAVFDIGGGSTEIVLGRPGDEDSELSFVASFDLGSVRLTERFVAHNPPTPAERAAATHAVREALSGLPPIASRLPPVGIAGTMTTLAAVALAVAPYDGPRLHGVVISREQLRLVVERLGSMTLETRKRVPGMEPKRADVIVAGGWIALALLDTWGAESVVVSDRGVRWGLAEQLAAGQIHESWPPTTAD